MSPAGNAEQGIGVVDLATKHSDDDRTKSQEPQVTSPSSRLKWNIRFVDEPVEGDTRPKLYQPLNQGLLEIRLLHILPMSQNGQFRLKLGTVSLKENPAFIALSYVCGDASVTKKITVSGNIVSVTSNLYNALVYITRNIQYIWEYQQYLGRQERGYDSESGVYFWIDALCIHQQEISEQNQQVQLMSSIYPQASYVLSWLGHSSGLKNGLSVLEFMSKKVAVALGDISGSEDDWLDECIPLCRQDYDPKRASHDPGTGNDWWDAVVRLLANSYWTRTWIVQEIALAKTVIFMHGNSFMEEFRLGHFRNWFNGLQSSLQPSKPSAMSLQLWSTITSPLKLNIHVLNTLLLLKWEFEEPSYPKDYDITPVAKTVGWKSSKQLDRIYGLLAICKSDIVVDYNRPPADVYCEFAKKWLSQMKNFDLLCYAGIGRPESLELKFQLPSWVADWNPAPFSHSTDECKAGGGSYQNTFEDNVIVDELILKIRAVPIDVIDKVEEHFSVEEIISYIQKYGLGMYPARIPRLLALLRLFSWELPNLADRNPIYRGCKDCEYASVFLHLLITYSPTMPWQSLSMDDVQEAANKFFNPLGIRTDEYFGEDISPHLHEHLGWVGPAGNVLYSLIDAEKAMNSPWRMEIERRIKLDMERRRFFHTKKGYLGIGIPSVQESDQVVVVEGFKYAVVLRPEGDKYRHVGVCYVAGIMDGEVFQRKDSDSIPSQVFQIC
jgi:hypothetical protein